MAWGEKYFSKWYRELKTNTVASSLGTVGSNPPTIASSEGQFILTYAISAINNGHILSFGTIPAAYNGLVVYVTLTISGAVASSISFVTGTAAQITGSTGNSNGTHTIKCTLNSSYDHAEFSILNTSLSQTQVTFSGLTVKWGEHEIKLLLDSYAGGTTEIEKKQPTALIINRRADKELQHTRHVRGSELQFNFFSSTADISAFDAIFQSEFKEWKVEHYYDAALDWTGYLLPENYSRNWINDGDYYALSLSASDGLARLKEIEYTNFSTGSQYTDRVSIITHIKRALEHLELELAFRVQLGTYVSNGSLMASTDCMLDKVTADSRRFTELKDGREVNKDCYTIINELLEDASCYLEQTNGRYEIINIQEKNSYYFPITWSGLTVGSRTARDLRLDIADYKYRMGSEVQKLRPIEEVQVTFRDRNIADNLLSNGDFSSGTTGWNKTGYFGSLIATSGYGEVPAVFSLDTPPTYIYTDNESITQINVDDQLEVTFKARIRSYVGTSGNEPLMKIELYQGANFVPVKSNNVFPMYESSQFTTYTVKFELPVTAADYQLRFYTYARSTGNFVSFNFEMDDVVWVPIYADGEDLTFDKFYSVKNADSIFTDVIEGELFFGDSQQDNDIGAFKVGTDRTETWNRYGKSEDESIQVLYAQNIIENFARYKDYIRAIIFDPSHTISTYSIVQEDSKDFQILSIKEVYGAGLRRELVCELAEVLNTAVTTTVSSQNLTSVDGQSTAPTEVYVPPASGDTPTLDEVTDEGSTTTNTIQVGSLQIGASKWDLKLNGNDLEFEYNSTVVAKLTSAGYFSVADEIEGEDTGL